MVFLCFSLTPIKHQCFFDVCHSNLFKSIQISDLEVTSDKIITGEKSADAPSSLDNQGQGNDNVN